MATCAADLSAHDETRQQCGCHHLCSPRGLLEGQLLLAMWLPHKVTGGKSLCGCVLRSTVALDSYSENCIL